MNALAKSSIIALLALAYAVGIWAAAAPPVRAGECVTGKASYYCCEHHGRRTASGAVFDQNAMTAAMPDRSQFGTYRVTHGGKSVTVKVNDTGGFAKYGRIIDLSRGAFAKLADPARGVIVVCVERLR